MKQRAIALLVLLAMLFGQLNAIASDADESVIEKTYNIWVQATNAKDIEWWSTYLDPQAVFLPPGVPPLKTKEAILDYYREAFADPHFALDCRQLGVEISRSGEMAWAHGRCQATFTHLEGQRANGTSRWLKVWIRQADGSWKCRINTWNYESQ